MIRRQLHSLAFSETWGRQMRFIVGPRQAGKTTLAKMQLAEAGCTQLYYPWDSRAVRDRYRQDELFFTADHPVDEQHLVHAAALGHVPLVQVCAVPGIAVRQRQGVFRLSATRLFVG